MNAGHQENLVGDELRPRSSRRLLAGVLNSSHDGIMAFESVRDGAGIIVDFIWTVVNPAAEQIVGRTADDITGKRLLEEMPGNRESGLFDIYVRVVDTGEPYVQEHHYHHEGLDNWFLTTAVRLDDGFAVTFRDITESKRLQGLLEHELTHDRLTGLANRVQLEEQIGLRLADLADSGGVVTIALLDLDRFKVVNDSLGHTAGDALLVEFARRIVVVLGSSHLVARVGNDEFVVVFDNATAGERDDLIARVMAVCDEPFSIEDHDVFVGVTVGVAEGAASTTPDILLADADDAMEAAKRLGGNRVAFAQLASREASLDRVRLEADLRVAIEQDQLRVVYQPVVRCSTGDIRGAEALVRWEHPERGWLSPGAFLPIAEQTGLIVPLSSWVLRRATMQLADWDRHLPGSSALAISVNAAAQQLTSDGFPDEVADALTASGVAPERLCIEVTETGLIRDPAAAQRTLKRLAELGVLIALDDFGTGYSPLTYLQQFPVDIIKIDRSFISGPDPQESDAALVDGLIGLADSLGKRVTAEGVENLTQLERVARADHYQGFHFSAPVDRNAFEALFVATNAPHDTP